MKLSEFRRLEPELIDQINRYVQCRLTQGQIDALWEKIIQSEEALEYLKNRVNLGYLLKDQQQVMVG